MAAFKLPKGLVLPLAAGAIAIATSMANFFEGERYVAYQDVGGRWTICDGHTGDVRAGQVATQAECDAYRAADVAAANAAVKRLITVPLTPYCEAGLTDFTVNLGAGTLARSSPRALFNAGDYAGGAAAIELYDKVAGRDCHLSASHCAGIVVRRAVERWLCELDPTP